MNNYALLGKEVKKKEGERGKRKTFPLNFASVCTGLLQSSRTNIMSYYLSNEHGVGREYSKSQYKIPVHFVLFTVQKQRKKKPNPHRMLRSHKSATQQFAPLSC